MIRPCLLLAGLLAMLTPAPAVRAHAPHDVARVLAVSPTYPVDTTLFGSFMFIDQRAFGRSTDGGESWELRQLPMAQQNIVDFGMSPDFAGDGTAFCASGGGLYRTLDRGLTWTRLDGGLGTPICTEVAVSPDFANDGAVLLATRNGAFRSTDAGDSWQPADSGLAEASLDFVTFASARGGQTVAFIGGAVVHSSADLGASWTPLADVGSTVNRLVASADFAQDLTLVAATQSLGVQVSRDAGLSFVAGNQGQPDTRVLDVVFDRQGGLVAAGATAVTVAPGPLDTWTPLVSGLEAQDPLGTPHYWDLGVLPGQGRFVLAAFEGLFRHGESPTGWEQLNVQSQVHASHLLVSPDFARDGELLAAVPGGGMLSWHVPVEPALRGPHGPSAGPVHGASGVAPAPAGPGSGPTHPIPAPPPAVDTRSDGLGSLWLNGVAISPDYATDDTLFSCYVGLYRSGDRGRSWDRLTLPAGVVVIRDVSVSPDFARDGVLFIGTNGVGVFRSDDRGETWSETTTGLPLDLRTRRLVLSPGFAADQTVFLASWYSGIWRSTDGGASWSQSGGAMASAWLQTLAISPDFAADGMLLAAEKPGRLWRSVDQGASWHPADAGLPTGEPGMLVTGLAFSPDFAADRRVAVALGDGSVWLSTDGADSWQGLTTFPDGQAWSLAFSPDVARDGLLLAAAPPLMRMLSLDGPDAVGPGSPALLRGQGEHFVVSVSAGWEGDATGDVFGNQLFVSEDAGAWRELAFRGRRVSVHASRGPDAPIMDLFLDGQPVGSVDLYAPLAEDSASVFQLDLPAVGSHRLRLEHSGTANVQASGQRLATNGFSVLR